MNHATISKLIGKFDFFAQELIEFDIGLFTDDELMSMWDYIRSFEPAALNRNLRKHKSFFIRLCNAASKKYLAFRGLKEIRDFREMIL